MYKEGSMDPVALVAGSLAVLFALLAMLQWRRAADLEGRVRELEAKLAEAVPPPKEPADAEKPRPPEQPEATEERSEAEPEAEEAGPEEEPEAAEEEPEAAEEGPGAEAAEPEHRPEPEREPAPPPKPAGPDPLRLKALEVVSGAFETCRYLDFDAIVEKPSTYRVTLPMTADNGEAVRHLEDGMFPCLVKVSIEGSKATLHIDTSKGPP
jgi:hypothetical protein